MLTLFISTYVLTGIFVFLIYSNDNPKGADIIALAVGIIWPVSIMAFLLYLIYKHFKK